MENEQLITITSPLDGSVLGNVNAMSKSDIDEVIQKSKKVFDSWRAIPLNERCEILYKAANLLVTRVDELTDLLVKEVGKDKKVQNQK